MTDALLEYRSEFPILSETTYLISNSLGAMPRGAFESLRDYAETWATRGVRAWEERWWTMALEVGNQIGDLMNSPANSVSLHGNVTQCQAVVASCFDFDSRRNKVVYSNLNFPSVMYFWEGQRSCALASKWFQVTTEFTCPSSACSKPSTSRHCLSPCLT